MAPDVDSAGAAGEITSPRVLLPFAAVTLIWGSTWLVIRDQVGVVPAAWSVTYRFALACAAMFVWVAISRQSARLDRRGHLLALLFALPQFVINFNLVYWAEKYVTSGVVAVVFALLVIPNALLGWLFLKQRMAGRFVIGSAIAMAGVALLFVHELQQSGVAFANVLLGIALSVVGMLFVSVANLMQAAPAMRSRSLPVLIAWGMLYATIANTAFALAAFGPPTGELRLGYWLGVAYLGIAGSAVAFTLYYGVIREIGPAKAAYSGVIVPIIAMLLSTAFEGYRWSPAATAGGVLSIIGLILALRSRQVQVAAPPLRA